MIIKFFHSMFDGNRAPHKGLLRSERLMPDHNNEFTLNTIFYISFKHFLCHGSRKLFNKGPAMIAVLMSTTNHRRKV